METPKNFHFLYTSENLGDLTISHKSRNENSDVMVVKNEKGKEVLSVTIPFETKTANGFKIIFDALESIDYKLL